MIDPESIINLWTSIKIICQSVTCKIKIKADIRSYYSLKRHIAASI